MNNDIIKQECYSLIVKISCLLVYYEFKLTPVLESRFQNSKKLFYVGSDDDLPLLFFKLYDIEQKLLIDIWEIHDRYCTHEDECSHELETEPRNIWKIWR